MVPRTSNALEVRDIWNTWMDDTRATNASEVRIPRVCHMLPEQHPTQMLYTWCATFEKQMLCKARITRVAPGVGSALLSMGSFGQYCTPGCPYNGSIIKSITRCHGHSLVRGHALPNHVVPCGASGAICKVTISLASKTSNSLPSVTRARNCEEYHGIWPWIR
jgi:hypothetical protein